MQRPDDFAQRRQHLAKLSDQELHERFWKLANDVVRPLVELAETNTSPSIERSVLLRMGFSSLEAAAIVKKVMDRGLLGKGAGHIVWRVATDRKLSIRDAGLALARGEHWDAVDAAFGGAVR
ncbi:MAG: ornithine aminomutase subunit alpha [Chloroflexota bacterium]